MRIFSFHENDLRLQSRLQFLNCRIIRFRALHRNRRAVGSIPTRGPCAAFFAVVPGQLLKCIYTHLDYAINPIKKMPMIKHNSIEKRFLKECLKDKRPQDYTGTSNIETQVPTPMLRFALGKVRFREEDRLGYLYHVTNMLFNLVLKGHVVRPLHQISIPYLEYTECIQNLRSKFQYKAVVFYFNSTFFCRMAR